MAKSRRGRTGKDQSKAEEIVETVETEAKAVETEIEAVVEEATDAAAEVEASVDDVVSEAVEADVAEDAPDATVEDASEPVENVLLEEAKASDDAEVPLEAEAVDETVETSFKDSPSETPEPQVIRETVVEKKSGFMSTAVGGAVAAILGFGAAQFVGTPLPFFPQPAPNPFEEEARGALKSQSDQIETLVAQSADTQKAVEIIDLAPVVASVAGLEDQINGSEAILKAMGDELASFDSRLTAIEKAPMADAVSPESIAAYERELDALRKSITDQQAALEVQRVEIQAMAAEAIQAESNAEGHATLAASRAALAEITAMLQTGKSFAQPLAVLTDNGVAVPAALSSVAADGVPTLTALAGEFPELARNALNAARKAGGEAEADGGGLASFFQKQLGARSVTPREGDDPDAVLSRAEAAVKSGDLDTALTEIDALPDAAKAELDGWLVQAGMQRDALAAAAALSQELNK